eukprot:1063607_1
MAERAHKWFKMCLLMFIEIFQPIKCFVASIVFTEIMFPLLILFHCHASSFRWFYHVFPYLFVMFQRFLMCIEFIAIVENGAAFMTEPIFVRTNGTIFDEMKDRFGHQTLTDALYCIIVMIIRPAREMTNVCAPSFWVDTCGGQQSLKPTFCTKIT